MKRSDRKVENHNDIIDIIKRCDVCRLALKDGDYPYIIPLNFGLYEADGNITLYFHGAAEGKKHELIKNDSRAGFEMDHIYEFIKDDKACSCTVKYDSVIGCGDISYVEDDEKHKALSAIMEHYFGRSDYEYNQKALESTTIFKLEVKKLTAKSNLLNKKEKI